MTPPCPCRARQEIQLGCCPHGYAPGVACCDNGLHLLCLTPLGSCDWECPSSVLGSSLPLPTVMMSPPLLPYLCLHPVPLSADQSMHGKAQEEDDTEAPGMLPSERKGKEVYFFLFHTPSSLMASACFPKLNHRFREKGWDLNRSENNGGGFPGGAVVKNLSANTGDTGSIPGLGRSPGGGDGNPLQYSCLGNPLDRGAW